MKKITSLILLMFSTLVSYAQILSNDFEGGIPPGWVVSENGLGINVPWSITTLPALVHSGTSSLMVPAQTGSVVAPVEDWFISPTVNLTGILNPKMSFYGRANTGVSGNSRLDVRVSVTNTDFSSFVTIASFQDFNAGAPNPISAVLGTYGFQELGLAAYRGRNIHVAFVMVSEGNGKLWAIDDISIFEDCPEPTDLGIRDIGPNAATATWTNPLNAPAFEIAVMPATDNPTTITPTYTSITGVLTKTFTDLSPNTEYKYYIRSVCDVNSFSDWVGPFTFGTTPLPAELPYTEGFEAYHGWQFINGIYPNKWYVGTDTHNGGLRSMYISNNEGLNNTYTTSTSITRVHAYRDLQIPTGTQELSISFDWKCVGEGTTTLYDYFKVWLVPTDFMPVANTAITAVQNQRILVAPSLNQNNTWLNQNYIVNIPAAFAGNNVRLVFEWLNDGGGGAQPPAAIDNINVKAVTCTAPTNLTISGITQNSAIVSWVAPNNNIPTSYDYFVSQSPTTPLETDTPSGNVTATTVTLNDLEPGRVYYVWIRGNCGSDNDNSLLLGPAMINTQQVPAELPYSENFDNPGFVFGLNNGTQVNKWIVGSDTFSSPGNSLYITNNDLNNAYTTGRTSVVHAYRDISIPADATELQVSFDWKAVGEANRDFLKVWLVTNTYMPNSGTSVPNGGDRIRIGVNYNSQSTWQRVNNVINIPAAIAGTDRRIVFEWVNDASGGVQPPAAVDNINVRVVTCMAPTNLILNSVTFNSAVVSWNAPATSSPQGYDYYVTRTFVAPLDTDVPTGTVTGTTVTIEGLEPGQDYYIWVRSNCGDDDGTSFILGPLFITTTQVPAEIPYSENFDSEDYVIGILNGNGANNWIVGSDTFLSANKSLYISNNGINNLYTTSSASVSHAFRDIFIPQGVSSVQVTFDWKAQGEGTTTSLRDYMKVWIVPVDFFPTSGIALTADEGRVQVGAGLNQRATWTNFSEPVSTVNFQNTAVKLVFEWINDSSVGTQPPAAVDNISVEAILCSAPTNLNVGLACDDPAKVEANWTRGGYENSWEYVVLPAQAPQPTRGTVIYNPFVEVYDLTPETEYMFWVRAICGGDNGKSLWVKTPFSISESSVTSANPFCAGAEGIVFPNVDRSMGVPNLTNGRFHCLGSTPNPVWYYLEVDQAGRLDFQIVQNTEFNAQGNPIGRTLDVDYIAFGPFDSLADACSNVVVEVGYPNPDSMIVGCSYSAAAVENFSITNGQPGQVYAILITNFNGSAGFIKLIQTNAGQPGAGLTSCDFLCEVDLGPDRVLCNQDEVVLRANIPTVDGAITSIEWYFEGVLMDPNIYNTQNIRVNQSGEYSVIVEKENCPSEEPITDSVNITFSSSYQGEIPSIFNKCDMDQNGVEIFDLYAFAAGFIPAGSGYTATFYNTSIDASNNENPIQSPYESAGESIFIRVDDGTGSADCVRIHLIELKVIEAIIPIVEFDYDAPICVNGFSFISPNLAADFTLGGTFSSTEGLVIDSRTGEINLEFSQPGDYVVKYEFEISEGLCGEDEVFSTQIKVLPKIGFMLDGYCHDGNYTISAIDVLGTLDFNTVTFEWSNNVVSSQDHTAIVDKEGKYRLTVTTAEGCVETVEIEVNNVYCEIPKGISPNGDGKNDSFVLHNFKVEKLQIFNRFGQEVFTHGSGYINQWFGQSNSGGDLPSGTYFYNIVTPYETFTGWVQLVREQN